MNLFAAILHVKYIMVHVNAFFGGVCAMLVQRPRKMCNCMVLDVTAIFFLDNCIFEKIAISG